MATVTFNEIMYWLFIFNLLAGLSALFIIAQERKDREHEEYEEYDDEE